MSRQIQILWLKRQPATINIVVNRDGNTTRGDLKRNKYESSYQ